MLQNNLWTLSDSEANAFGLDPKSFIGPFYSTTEGNVTTTLNDGICGYTRTDEDRIQLKPRTNINTRNDECNINQVNYLIPITMCIPATLEIVDITTDTVIETVAITTDADRSGTVSGIPFGRYSVRVTDCCGDIYNSYFLFTDTNNSFNENTIFNAGPGYINHDYTSNISILARASSGSNLKGPYTLTITNGPNYVGSPRTGEAPQTITYPKVFSTGNAASPSSWQLSDLPAGTYNITISDACGVTYDDTFEINDLITFNPSVIGIPGCVASGAISFKLNPDSIYTSPSNSNVPTGFTYLDVYNYSGSGPFTDTDHVLRVNNSQWKNPTDQTSTSMVNSYYNEGRIVNLNPGTYYIRLTTRSINPLLGTFTSGQSRDKYYYYPVTVPVYVPMTVNDPVSISCTDSGSTPSGSALVTINDGFGPYTFVLKDSGGTEVATSGEIAESEYLFTGLAEGLYTIEVTDICSTIIKETNIVFADYIPSVNISSPEVCIATPATDVTLTVSPAYAIFYYEWFDATGTTSLGTGATLTVAPTTTTNYIVKATVDSTVSLCSSTNPEYQTPVTITVNPLPVLINTFNTTVYSDEITGITLAGEAIPVATTSYNITAININGLTAIAGNPIVANNVSASEIANDAFRNTGVTAVDVIYTIAPVSDDGCVGDTIDVVVTVEPLSDLSLTKTVNNALPKVGDTIIYTIKVKNDGPSAATGIQVTDALPTGVSFESVSTTHGAYDDVNNLWSLATTLTSGSEARLDITVKIINAGVIVNTAEIKLSDQNDPDSIPKGN